LEKAIVKRILDIQAEGNVDLTGLNQPSFKQKKRTRTFSLYLQAKLARPQDEDECQWRPAKN
jgi:hypothetical protein